MKKKINNWSYHAELPQEWILNDLSGDLVKIEYSETFCEVVV